MEHGLFGWVFLIVGLVFLFGNPKRLSDLGRGMGSFLKEFRAAQKDTNSSEPGAEMKNISAAEAPKLSSGESGKQADEK